MGRQVHWGGVDALKSPAPAPAKVSLGRNAQKWDEMKLWQLGYKQELRRKLTLFNNMGCVFTVMSCFVIVDLFALQGLTFGGPVVIIWGWIGVAISTLCIGACLAELCSAFPTAGGLYFCCFVLAPPRLRRIACWITGWTNLLGQVAFISTTELAAAKFLVTLASLHMSGPEEGPGWEASSNQFVGVFAALLVTHALLSSARIEVSAMLLTLGTLWHFIAVPAFLITLLAVAPQKQSARWVLTEWMPNTEVHGITNPTYISMVGLLMSQWNLCGYDAAMHLAEETQHGDWSASVSIPLGIAFSAGLGLFSLLVMLFCIQSVEALTDPTSIARGGMAQLTYDVFKARTGMGWPAVPMLYIPAIAMWFCSFNCVLAGGRMAFAVSRDGVLVGSRWWRLVTHGTPVHATWLMAVLAFLLGLPAIFNTQVFNAISSMCVAALNISYIIPILLRLRHGRQGFITGPFKLGAWYLPLAIIGTSWVVFSTVAFSMPTMYPITYLNFNYAPILLLLLLAFSLILWWGPWGGTSWFQGPSPNLHNVHARGQVPLPSSASSYPAQHSEQDANEDSAASTQQVPPAAKLRQPSDHQLVKRHSVLLGELISMAEEEVWQAVEEGEQLERATKQPGSMTRVRAPALPASASLRRQEMVLTFDNPLCDERLSARLFKGDS